MNNIYENILNKNTGQQFYTGTVITLSPLTIKIFTDDTAIPVVPTSNLAGIAVGNKCIFTKIGAQFFAIGYVGSPKMDCIELIKSTEQSITDTSTVKVEFDSVNKQTGSNFSLDSYGVKVGAGIAKVKVDLQLWMHCETEDAYSVAFIYKNASQISYSIFPKRDTNSANVYLSDKWRINNCTAFIDVVENDYIYAYARFSIANASNKIDDASGAGKLIVQAIEYNFS